jgi:hypothetical protein
MWAMQTHITIRALAATALLLPALALAACGGEDEAPAADREQQALDAQLAYAKCMREQGIDMPDPKPAGEGGITMIAPKDASPEKMQRADAACRKHLKDLEPPKLSEEQQREFQEAALRHARCMREHGIDMPDPTFGDDGGARIRLGKGSGIDPNEPDFKKAQEACRGELPRGGATEVSP